MHVSVHGDDGAASVLLLHGGGVAGWMWAPLRDHLNRRMRIIVPDLPGHDRSANEDYISHAHTLDELVRMLESLRVERVTVVGFSLGAQLAILLASRCPNLVDRVAVISAQAIPLRMPGATLALVRSTAGLAARPWFARLQAKELFIPDDLLDDYLRTSSLISRDTLVASVGENIRFTIPAEWSTFPGKAMLIAGAAERSLMRASASALHDALPSSTLEIVEGVGHGLPLQRPDLLAERLDVWSNGERG